MKAGPGTGQARRAGVAIVVAILAAAGVWLASDRPGLSQRFRPGTASWSGDVVWSETSVPQVSDSRKLRRVLSSLDVFSLSWHGWLEVERAGTYRFSMSGDEGAYLKLGGETVLDLEGTDLEGILGETRSTTGQQLVSGLYPIEIGAVQTRGEPILETIWKPPGEEARALDPDRLYDRRPTAARRWLRRAIGGISPFGRRILGAVLLIAALGLGTAELRARSLPTTARKPSSSKRRPLLRRGAKTVLLTLLAIGTFLVCWRAAGSPLGAEDAHWLQNAVHGTGGEHAAHRLLLKAFVSANGGEAFAAARSASAFLMTVTMLALVLGASAFAAGARVAAVIATVLVFGAQSVLFSDLGAVRPQFSAMAWVTLGFAICLSLLSARRPERQVLVIGAVLGVVTLLAIRSHPTGAILLWPGLLLLRENERWAPRRAVGRLGAWLSGLVTAQLMVAGAVAATGNGAAGAASSAEASLSAGAGSAARWMEVLWPGPAGAGVGGSVRALALLMVGAALAAGGSRSLERQLVHLTPLVFSAGLLVHRSFVSEPLAPSDLLPILPTACLVGAALFAYAGLDRLSRQQLLAPRMLLPVVALAAVVAIVAPYLLGRLSATDILPWLRPAEAGDLLRRTLAPGLALVLVLAAALSLRFPRLRLPALLTAAVLTLGPGVAATTLLLASRQPAQRAEAVLYPWSRLDGALRPGDRTRIAVSPALLAGSEMFGSPSGVENIARLYLDAPTLEVGTTARDSRHARYLFVTPAEERARNEQDPAAATRVWGDEAGRLVLLRIQSSPDRKEKREQRRQLRRRRRAGDGESGAEAPPKEPRG